eukprot:g5553.t1
MAVSLSFIASAFHDLLEEDGLAVFAKGLGITRLLSKFVRLYCDHKYLVFVLNAENIYDSVCDFLFEDGVSEEDIPRLLNSTCGVSAAQRRKLYDKGGCIFVTNSVLLNDLLTQRLDATIVTGFLINQAERVASAGQAGFILRIYRRSNQTGFVKAFSESPEQLVNGFSKAEKVLRALSVRQLYLFPRFHVTVADSLERRGTKPDVFEITQPLTSNMLRAQKALLEALRGCLYELKRSARSHKLDASDLSTERALLHTFDRYIGQQFGPVMHKVSRQTKQIMEDIRDLRKLMHQLLRCDAVTFLETLDILRRKQDLLRVKSPWIMSSASDKLFKAAKARVYVFEQNKQNSKAITAGKIRFVLEPNPKWGTLASTLASIRKTWQKYLEGKKKKGEDKALKISKARVLLLVRDIYTMQQVQSYLCSLSGQNKNNQIPALLQKKIVRFMRRHYERSVSLRKHANTLLRTSRVPLETAALWRETEKFGLVDCKSQMVGTSPLEQSTDIIDINESDKEALLLEEHLETWILEGKRLPQLSVVFAQWEENIRFVWKQERGDLQKAVAELRKERKKQRKQSSYKDDDLTPGEKDECFLFFEKVMVDRLYFYMQHAKAEKKRNEEKNEEKKHIGTTESMDVAAEDEEAEKKSIELAKKLQAEEYAKVPSPTKVPSAGKSPSQQRGQWRATAQGTRQIPFDLNDAHLDVEGGATPGEVDELWWQHMATQSESISSGSQTISILSQELDSNVSANFDEIEGDLDIIIVPRLSLSSSTKGGGSHSIQPSLEELQPQFVILYDPWPSAVRQIEVYNAIQAKLSRGRDRENKGKEAKKDKGKGKGKSKKSQADSQNVQVYFFFHKNSVEEQIYLTEVENETSAFKKLIAERSHMVLPSRMEMFNAMTATSGIAPSPSTRSGGSRRVSQLQGRIVVDTREFRSQLPARLYESGVEIKPVTIDVGDYILTPDCCVERKSISDLFGSFGSGRLYAQATAMCRHYSLPTLLIEFDPAKPFSLQSRREIPNTIKQDNIISRIVLLTRHFPKLRIIWSRSPFATVDLFKVMKENREEPNVDKAASMHTDEATTEGGESNESETTKLAAKDVLFNMPGVSKLTVRKLRKSAKTISDIVAMDEETLADAMGAKKSAKLLYNFLNATLN